MRDHRDGLVVPEAHHIAAVEDRKDAAFEFDCGMGRLIQNAPQVAVALGGAAVVVSR